MFNNLRKSLLTTLVLQTSVLLVAAQAGTISSPASNSAIAPGQSFNFAYNARGDYSTSSLAYTVWLFTSKPDAPNFATPESFMQGIYMGRFQQQNAPAITTPSSPAPGQLVMPDLSAHHGFGTGENVADQTVYLAVLEEYGNGTPTFGFDISLTYNSLMYNATTGGGSGTTTTTTSLATTTTHTTTTTTHTTTTTTHTTTTTQAPAATPRTIRPGKNNNMCLQVDNANEALVTLQSCTGAANQQWSYSTPGFIKIYGNMCLDVACGSTQNGVAMMIYQCYDGDSDQQWVVTNDNRIAWEGMGQCLDLNGGSDAAGNVMQTWACGNGNNNQVWNFV